jgi:hypothetical protein
LTRQPHHATILAGAHLRHASQPANHERKHRMKLVYDDGFWWICNEKNEQLIGFDTEEEAERELEQIEENLAN